MPFARQHGQVGAGHPHRGRAGQLRTQPEPACRQDQLYGPGPALSHGVAIEVNRIIVGHLRLGVGWNFTNFTDDETRLGDGRENGFFVRAQGFY